MPDYDIDKLRQLLIAEVIGRETGNAFVRRGQVPFTLCPLHDDKNPSLSIKEDSNEWFCHACNVGGDVIRFIELHKGLEFQEACKHLSERYAPDAVKSGGQDKGQSKNNSQKSGSAGRKAKPQMPIPEKALFNLIKALERDWWEKNYGKPVAAWRYHDAKGGVAYCDVRFEKQDKGKTKKQVLPIYYAKNGKWKMGIPFTALDRQRILYNLHKLTAEPQKPALVVEGCKCASVDYQGLSERFILTTWPGGTNGIPLTDVRALFGRKVYIWPDNDSLNVQQERGGYKAAYYLGAKLQGKSDFTILRAAEHPGGKETKHGYDIEDYVKDGGDPVKYVLDADNIISIEDARQLAGLEDIEPAALPDFRDVRKFTVLENPDPSVTLKVMTELDLNRDGLPKKIDGNFLHITESDPLFSYLVAYDTATNDIKFSDRYKELDELDNQIWQYCQRHYSIAPNKTQRTDMIKSIAYRNIFNSLEIFLNELEAGIFNGEAPEFKSNPLAEILEHLKFSFEEEYLNYDEIHGYYYELFDKYFLKMFLKIECIINGKIDEIPPADIVPILEGDQGIGKTRLCYFLSLEPHKYYVDMAELQLTTSRDTLAKIRGKLIGELGELAGLKRTELEAIKAFISATFDEMRRLYSENTYRSPRTISFIGTTNEREYLRDTTGNRRFWPVRISYVDNEVFEKKELVKRLYVYYRIKARQVLKEKTIGKELLVSGELIHFMNYLREEKRVKPAFLDSIMKYIEEAEDRTLSGDPVIISMVKAASTIFNMSEQHMHKWPPRFQSEMMRVLI